MDSNNLASTFWLSSEAERFGMGKRIREVEEGPAGAIWVLEDEKGGKLLRLSPKS